MVGVEFRLQWVKEVVGVGMNMYGQIVFLKVGCEIMVDLKKCVVS